MNQALSEVQRIEEKKSLKHLAKSFSTQSPFFNDKPFSYLEEIELRIESLTNLGEGVGRIDGWVVMVGGVIPGETIRAKIFKNHNNYSEAVLCEVLEPSEERVAPKCKLFGLCGGCQYQHMSLHSQRKWKRIQIEDVLGRIGGLKKIEVQPVIGTEDHYHYRSKITPHYDAPKKSAEGIIDNIGFKRKSFPIPFYGYNLTETKIGKIVDVPFCPIATREINEALPKVRNAAKENFLWKFQAESNTEIVKKRRKTKGATLLLRHTIEGIATDNKSIVTEKVKDLIFSFQAGEFFQNNPFVLPLMLDHVISQAKGKDGTKYLIDAYCGGGLFCLGASLSFEKCIGIEVSKAGIESAKSNAASNHLENCEFMCGNADSIFKNVDFDSKETAVIIDPPRKGCDESFLKQLFEYKPKRIVYVSCEPSTQARDTRDIVDAGYVVVDITPFDLFP
eukprot:CAMPEP_0171480240 /NCGR_PEP_ID=MMETSP0946-20130122/5938_1 /TAXON_ID=109269 /ORGANISM="Vaucheria litorea, Strain CCMP2940" /LENGTH=447 /DNA_ID=CAMNT_0012011395 /DNA_START=162 /DNA_END=1501 /DNA_ORIENTATION=+